MQWLKNFCIWETEQEKTSHELVEVKHCVLKHKEAIFVLSVLEMWSELKEKTEDRAIYILFS